jgi:hypothetical protein
VAARTLRLGQATPHLLAQAKATVAEQAVLEMQVVAVVALALSVA